MRPTPVFAVLVVVVVAAAAAGCVPNPARNVASTQEPLRLVMRSGTGTRTVERATGNTYDGDGNLKAQHTQFVNERFRWSDFDYYQGRQPLDEQDYFRLSRDQRAYEEVLAARRSAGRYQKLGVALTVAGIAGAVAGAVFLGDSEAALGVRVGAGIGGSIGITAFTFGQIQMKKKHHLPLARARAAADVVESCRHGRCSTVSGGDDDRGPRPRPGRRPPPPPRY